MSPPQNVAPNKSRWCSLRQILRDNVKLAHPLAKVCDLQKL